MITVTLEVSQTIKNQTLQPYLPLKTSSQVFSSLSQWGLSLHQTDKHSENLFYGVSKSSLNASPSFLLKEW